MVNWLSLAVPFAYLGVLIGSLATFSSLYRKRKAQKALSLEPWFPPHLQRDIYFSLLHIEPSKDNNNKEKKSPAVPDSVLKAALLRRATEDINRVMELRNQKAALAMLLQRGSVGDDLWQRFQRGEKEMEDEVRDVIAEANAYSPNWGQTIFQSANEMMNNALVRERIEAHQAKVSEERQWWDRRKTTIQEGFMKELDAEGSASAQNTQTGSSTTTTTAATAAPAAATTPSSSTASGVKTPESSAAPSVTGSDDDAVLVEAESQQTGSTPDTPASGGGGGGAAGGGGGGGGKKKKKGKK